MPPARTVESILVAAVEINSADERRRFVEQACGGDAELRQRVEGLIENHFRAGSFLEAPAHTLATADETFGDRAGVVIGPYRLLEPLGEGGFGVVYLAEQTEPVRRRVALKVLKPGMDSRQVVARFEQERQALALMDHPHIAKVLDGGATAEGRPYFVMELVRGTPITGFCDQNGLSVRQRLGLFVDVCQAVQHAHQKGVIHRDLKPSNVLVATHDGRAAVKVIDFGVAKAVGQPLTDKTLFTHFSQMIGTPLYMSPEQAGMSELDVDTRSDVYSLGVLLYELLTGTTPFEKGRFSKVGFDEIRRIIREEEPPRPSTRLSTLGQAATTASASRRSDPRRLSRLFRGELDWVAMKALEKDRDRRYESAAAFAADVRRYLHDEPVLACPPSAAYRLRKFVRRHKGPVLAAAAVVLLLAAGVVGTSAGLVRALAAERRTAAERDEKDGARRQARQALNTMTDEVVRDLLGRQGQLTDQHRAFLKKVLAYHEAFAAARADDPEGRKGRAEAYAHVGSIRHRLGELPEAEAAWRDALALWRPLMADFPDYQDVLAATLMDLGSLLRDTGRPQEAEEAYREALALQKRLADASPGRPEFRDDLASGHYNLGVLLHRTGRSQEAEEAWRDALAVQRELAAGSPDRPDFRHGLAKTYTSLGNLLTDTGRPKEAEAAWREALALLRRLAADAPSRPDYHQDLALAHNNLGLLLYRTGRPREAEAAYREALRLQKELAADFPNRPDYRSELAGTHYNLGVLLHRTGRSKDAEAAWRDALALRKQLAARHPNVPDYQSGLAETLTALAPLLRATGRPKEAEAAYRDALAVGRRLVAGSPDRPDFRHSLGLTHNNFGFLLYKLGRPKEAEAEYGEALALWERLKAEFPNRPDARHELARTHYNRGLLLRDARRPGEAEAAWQEALGLWKPLAAEFPKVPDFRVAAAGTLLELTALRRGAGRPEEAEAAWRDALALKERLAGDFPALPDYRNDLAGTLVNRAALHNQRREYAAAVPLLEQARPHHQAALAADPNSPTYRRFYRNNRWALAQSHLGLGDHARLAAAADELARAAFDPANDTYNAACFLCRCATLAGRDGRLDGARRQELATSYADRALALLRQAVARGYKDAAHMKQDADLRPLRGREEFRKLLAGLEGKAGG